MDKYSSALFYGIPIEELDEFKRQLLQVLDHIDHRTVNIESWYQELLENPERNEGEERLFNIMSETREIFIRIEESMNERRLNLPKHILERSNLRFGPKYYDWDSRPIHNWEYSFKYTYFNRHVAEDFINGWRISTVWLGLCHSILSCSLPTIFETMIFKEDDKVPDNEELDCYQRRYSFLFDAEEGHQETCLFVKEQTQM